MKTSSWLFAVVGIASVLPAHASDRFNKQSGAPAATVSEVVGSGSLRQIYRVAGVRDDGQAQNQGVATSFHCTNWSTTPERLAFRVYNHDGSLVRVLYYTVAAQQTFTASTHATSVFSEDALLSQGIYIDQGSVAIVTTSNNLHCSAMIVSAEHADPVGVPLHLVRVNSQTGTVE